MESKDLLYPSDVITPEVIEAAMRRGERLRAQHARDLFLAAFAGLASLWHRAVAHLLRAAAPRKTGQPAHGSLP